MASPHPDYIDNSRKRVGKACDRCRLKKSKCDGNSPCSRCKIDNAVCMFGERKKAQDRVVPKGYTELVESQHKKVVEGLEQMYRMALSKGIWPGEALPENDGHPLVHHILTHIGILDKSKSEEYEEPHEMEARLSSGQRRDTIHSDSGSESHGSVHSTPSLRTASISSSYSSSSSSSSRKRSQSPSHLHSEAPHQRRRHNGSLQIQQQAMQIEQQQQQQQQQQPQKQQSYMPPVMTVDYTPSPTPTFDFSNIDFSSFNDESFQYVVDPMAQFNYTGPTLGNVSVMNNYNNVAFDSDFDVFQHSGLQSNRAY